MSDLPEKIHRALYRKSGRANANSNNPDFTRGFWVGRTSEPGEDESSQDIELAWTLHGEPRPGEPEYAAFREWKRGYWAARLQKVCAENVKQPCGPPRSVVDGNSACAPGPER